MTSGEEQVAVVTGGNKGIGFAIVKQLCQQFQGVVYLASRDEARGKASIAVLEKLGLHPKFLQLDIDSLESIRGARKFLEETHGGIDILVNNAAIAYKNDATESFGEQAENTVRVNFIGTLNACRELFPLLRKHARVVNVSSSAGHLLKINGQEPAAGELRRKFSADDATEEQIIDLANNFIKLAKEGTHSEAGWPNSTYVVSKVTLSAVTRIQQRKFDKERPDDDIVISHVHPGYVDTDMTSHKGPLTIDEGARAPVFAALLPKNVETRGAYMWFDKTIVDWVNGPTPT